jgi:hypothetical protein
VEKVQPFTVLITNNSARMYEYTLKLQNARNVTLVIVIRVGNVADVVDPVDGILLHVLGQLRPCSV